MQQWTTFHHIADNLCCLILYDINTINCNLLSSDVFDSERQNENQFQLSGQARAQPGLRISFIKEIENNVKIIRNIVI